ncbi:zinc finger transcription factor ace1 [Grosmannia clavigera kw1407]|uniref:Zinc finger transcription factor ace1 n=1 Tax=Grosmannia clavigera (strain kw1407 / UAMH 11150) TaxID=655863 RepID=F0XI68_GROCL|nr:zinc finger transcription factor ace1 [Grosmannia clavigera kw1407]EFX03028.1 zinc finger transcription factor ace1 [Grosmannia clavigera kw1407]
MVLHKGATFHSPSSPASQSSTFGPPSLPRAQSDLDDVLDAHRRRVALELDSIDKTLASIHISTKTTKNKAALSSSNVALNSTFYIPKAVLDHALSSKAHSVDQRWVLQPRSVNRRPSNHHHGSDSGLGSSVASTSNKTAGKSAKRTSSVQAAAVTRSVASVSSTTEFQTSLSPRATNRIYEHTVKPLLAKPAYKVFHPLLLECTTKINKRDIVCLRDVEKTVLLLAPATVEYLSDREQTRPSDPPYTSGYFIDLVDQIRHYARQLADAKEKEASGTADSMELNSSDPIKLHGGFAVNGRPMELVRISRDGRAVSIATGLPVELEEDIKDNIRIKRSASQELEDEEEIMRSMARRKKNAPPEEYAPKTCSVDGCKKMFKRPCDLTKHEKTHSRPWKCPIPSCKYHDYGWPTEKEKDRHLNDKHSDNPPMYECLFKPCTYKSKRDSNRKQHMEKTHGWTYVRTKTNGSGMSVSGKPGKTGLITDEEGRASHDSDSMANTTPPLVNMPTPVSAQSPAVATPPLDEFAAPLYSHNMASYEFPTCTLSDVLATEMDLPAEIDDLDFSPIDNNSPSTISSLDNNSAYQDLGQDAMMFDDIYSATVQLPTPELNLYSNDKNMLDRFMALSGPDLCAPLVTPEQQQQLMHLQHMHQQRQQFEQQLQKEQYLPHISPLGEGNTMLYTPDSQIEYDEGFVDFPNDQMTKGDFILFPPAALNMRPTTTASNNLFDDLTPSLAAGYSQPNSQIFMDW